MLELNEKRSFFIIFVSVFLLFDLLFADQTNTVDPKIPERYERKVLFSISNAGMEKMRREYGPNNLEYAVFKNPDNNPVEFQVDRNEKFYILFGDSICLLDSSGEMIKKINLNLPPEENAGGKFFCVDENGNAIVARRFNVNGEIHVYNIDKGFLKTITLGRHVEDIRFSGGTIYSERTGKNLWTFDELKSPNLQRPPKSLEDFIEPSGRDDVGVYCKQTGKGVHAPRVIDGFDLNFVKSIDFEGNVYIEGVSDEESPSSENGRRMIVRLFKFDSKFNLLGFAKTDSFCFSCDLVDFRTENIYSVEILGNRYLFIKWEDHK